LALKDILIKSQDFFRNKWAAIGSLISVKTIFQIVVIKSGLRWLSADDYCRTVISYDWLQHPKIYGGVWLALHFWINGIFIWLFHSISLAPVFANTLFSILTLIFFYLIVSEIFNRTTAYLSCLIFAVFPFQVWLSSSGMPESIFFFFVITACYYFLMWYKSIQDEITPQGKLNLLVTAVIMMIFADLLRYEGWLFSITLIILTVMLSYRKFKFQKRFFVNVSVSLISLLSALWWLYQNYIDYNDAFFFVEETTRIFKDLSGAGFWQRLVQYPFFVFYIAPLTTVLGLRKIYLALRNKKNGFEGNFSLLKIFLLFNLIELLLLMLIGIVGSGGTNLISRYIVVNAIMLFPFAVWQLLDLKKYILISSVSVLVIVNIVWSFYYQQAYRDDTYEVAELTKRLIQRDYFEPNDKIYFEMTEGYYDIYPLQVISDQPWRFNSDTIPAYFPPNIPAKKQLLKKKTEDQQKLNILELRKFLEVNKIKLFIARSDLLIDKIDKLSYKSEQIGDYHIFYLSESKLKYHKGNNADNENVHTVYKFSNSKYYSPSVISFDKKLILKDYRIDNSNLGLNPQTITLNWQIPDISIFDSLGTDDDGFGRFKVRLELASVTTDSVAYDTYQNVFSERNVEEYFDTEEIKNILILKPFALLNYSKKMKLTPFESGLYEMRLKVIDAGQNKELQIFMGDSLYVYLPEQTSDNDTVVQVDVKLSQAKQKKLKEAFLKKPFYPLGRIIAIFPNVNYTEMLKRSKELSQIIVRNGLMLPFLQRYQGDQFLNVVFNYF
jgi:4-amino-4-deoxy-L-arabinose transferase-like glycosyltransferase